MFNTKHTLGRCSIIGICAAALAGGATQSFAQQLPEGYDIRAGSPNINEINPDLLNIILNDPATVIDWNSFNILNAAGVVNFSGNNAAVMNYVTGGGMSQINGSILAPNVSVFLVNPAGIVFGQNSFVDAGQFIAAAASISDAARPDFFDGAPHFENVVGQVVNRGTIEATEAVHLIGNQVRNRGTITVPNGFITVTAYNNGSVTLSGVGADGRYHVNLAGGDSVNVPNTGVISSGEMSAAGGTIQLGAGDMYSVAIRLDDSNVAPFPEFKMEADRIIFGSDPNQPNWNTDGHLQLGDNLELDADLAQFWGTVSSEAGSTHDLELTGNAEFHDAVGRNKDGDLHELGNLTVGGNAVAVSTIDLNDTLDIDGEATFGDDVTVGQDILVGERVTIAGADVTLDAGNEIDLGRNGTFDLRGLDGDENLTLISGAGAAVSGAVRNLNDLAVETGDLTAGDRITIDGHLSSTDANITAGTRILAGSANVDGNLEAQDGKIEILGDATIAGTTTASVSVLIGGNANFGGNVTANGGRIRVDENVTISNSLNMTALTTINVLGNLMGANGDENLTLDAGAGSTIGNDLANFNDVTTTAGSLTAGSIFDIGGHLDAAGSIQTTIGQIDVDGDINSSGSVIAQTSVSAGGDTNIDGQLRTLGGSISVDGHMAAGSARSAEGITAGSANIGGMIQAEDGNIVIDAHLQAGLALATGNIQAGSANISGLTDAGNDIIMTDDQLDSDFGGNVTAGNDVHIAGGATFGQNVFAGQDVIVDGDGTFGGNITAGRHVTLGGENIFNRAGNQTVRADGGSITANSGALHSNNSGNLILNAQDDVLLADVTVTDGSLDITGLLQATSLTADQSIIVRSDGGAGMENVSGNVTAIGGNVTVQDNFEVGGTIFAGSSITFGHHGEVGGDVEAGDNVTFGNSARIHGSVAAAQGSILFGNAAIIGDEANPTDADVTASVGNVTFGDDAEVWGAVGAGQSVVFGHRGTVGSDVIAENEDVTFGDDGHVFGNVEAGNDVTFGANGRVDGNVEAGDTVLAAGAGNIIFGPGATFGGNVIAGNNINLLGTATFNGAADQLAHAVKGTLTAGGLLSSTQSGDLTLQAGTLVNLGAGAEVVTAGDSLLIHGTLNSNGDLFAMQNVTVFNDSVINGNITAEDGTASFAQNSVLDNTAITGDVTAGVDAIFWSEASITGNVLAQRDALFFRDSSVTGDVTTIDRNIAFLGTSNVGGDVAAGQNVAFSGHATLGGNVYAGTNPAENGNVGFGADGATFIGSHQFVEADGGNIEALGLLEKTSLGDLTLDGTTGVRLDEGARVDMGSLLIYGDLVSGVAGVSSGNLFASQNVTVFNSSDIYGNVTAQNGAASFGMNSPAGNTSIDGDVDATNDATFWNDAMVTGHVTSANRDVIFLSTSNVRGDVTAGRNVVFNDHAQLGGNVLAFNDVGFSVFGATFDGAGDQDVTADNGNLFAGGELLKETDGLFTLKGQSVDVQAIRHTAMGDVEIRGPVAILLNQDVDVQGGSLTIYHDFTALRDLLASEDIDLEGAGTFAGDGVDQNVLAGGSLRAAKTLTSSEAGNLTLGGLLGIMLEDTVDVQDGSLTIEDAFTALANLLASENITLEGDGTFAGIGVDQIVEAGGDLEAMGLLTSTEAGDLLLRGLASILLHETVDVQDGSLTIDNDFTALRDLIASNNINLIGAGDLAGVGVDQVIDAGETLHAHSTLTSTEAGDLILRGLAGILLDATVDVQDGSLTIENDFTALANLLASQNITLEADGTFAGAGGQEVLADAGTLHAMGELNKTSNGSLTLGGGAGITLEDVVRVLGNSNLFVLNDVTINGGMIQTTGSQEYQGTVTLGADTELFAGNTVIFQDTVNSDDQGTWALAVRRFVDTFGNEFGGNVVIMGDIGTAADGLLQAFIVEGNAELGADIMVANGIRFDGTVDLFNDSTMMAGGIDGVSFGSNIDGAHVLTVDTAVGDITFGGRVGENTPLAGLILNARDSNNAMIIFDTDLVHVIGDILLNVGNAPPTDHSIAQIGGTMDLTLIAEGGEFEMGQSQKMTVLGNLLIDAETAVLGDLNTLGDMRVEANEIIILLRDGDPNDDDDLGTDFVAGGQIFFAVVPTTRGEGLPPQFANPAGDADLAGTIQGFLIRAFGDALVAGDLRDGGTFFDLKATGPATTDLSTALAAEMPTEEETEETDTEAGLPGEAIEALIERGFLVRVLDGPELVNMTAGRGMYIDGRNMLDDIDLPLAPEGVALTGGQPMDVTLVRGLPEDQPWPVISEMLRTRPVLVMQRISRGMLEPVIDSIDLLYASEDPEISQEMHQRHLEFGIELTWHEFRAAHPDAPAHDYARFLRQFVTDAPDADEREAAELTLEFMAKMRELERRLHSFGMSRAEANRMIGRMLRNDFLPTDVQTTEFMQAMRAIDG